MLLDTPDGVALRTRLLAHDVSCNEVADAFLSSVDPDEINAWAAIDAELLRAAATALDGLTMAECERLPLFGLPVGLKDNFDTADLPTAYGSPIYAGWRPQADATVVRRLRSAGAMIAGKTKLAEFAWMHPPDTLNPLDRARTPGGSSSGSAAAVGAGVVPLATGTQTAGSVIRPASYCGVVGYKPTFGLISTDGIKPLSNSLDTVGLLARSVRDVVVVAEVLAGDRLGERTRLKRPRIAFARTPIWDQVDPQARRAIENAIDSLTSVEEIELPPGFEELIVAQTTIQSYESAVNLTSELACNSELLSHELRGALAEGASLSTERYEAELDARARLSPPLVELLARYDGVLTPSTTGFPPIGLDFTGDPVFSRAWNVIGAPSVSLPLAWSEHGLPAGLQLVGAPSEDRRLLAVASWLLDT